MKVRIFEIFTSIEGEGILYGTKTLFVRLAGCPFSCFYCDTTEALPAGSGTEYDIQDALDLVTQNIQPNTFKVNFTGGDPLVQHKAVARMARHIKMLNIATYLESSCFDSKRFDHILPYIDYTKIEFKTPDSEFVPSSNHATLQENAMRCLEHATTHPGVVYIKVVVSDKTSPDYIQDLADEVFQRISSDSISGFVIQPTWGVAQPSLESLLKMYDSVYPLYEQVRVVPQMHKYIGAP